ncbi:MAG: 16S rRNA (guanine(527)-N(7))-methyltransferase RsmG [Flavobacteriales bacterium]
MSVKLIKTYFPKITPEQEDAFAQLKPLYEEWNEKINVISRKDLDNFYERHVLHSLAIAHFAPLKPDQKVLDIGTGGGFPGIPLAIMYPDTQFTLVDSIGKKIQVVKAVAEALELKNVKAFHERAENLGGKYDLVISRAVAKLSVLITYCQRAKFGAESLVCLKGGDLTDELKEIGKLPYREVSLSSVFKADFFETKKLIEVIL